MLSTRCSILALSMSSALAGSRGCISHDVHVDCQNPMRLFFVEQWADEAALRTHFAVEGSKAFVRSLKGRIVETSGTKIYRAEAIPR